VIAIVIVIVIVKKREKWNDTYGARGHRTIRFADNRSDKDARAAAE